MKLGLHQSARLEQRLLQSPQMIQAMQILQLPGVELADRIEQELEENPFLERVEDEPTDEPAAPEVPTQREREVDSILEQLERLEGDYGDGAFEGQRSLNGSREDGDRKLEAMANTPAGPRGLRAALVDDLGLLELDPRQRAVAEHIVWSLDGRGYLQRALGELVPEVPVEPLPTEEELAAVLELLREAFHPALGARDLRESLLLQLDRRPPAPLARTLVEHHLEDLSANRLPRIARETGRDIEEVKQALEILRHLDPSPGAEFGEATAAVILPDIVVEPSEEEPEGFELRLVRQRQPELRLSAGYRQILRQLRRGGAEKEWARKRIESARWFLDALQQRGSTLERIARAVFRRQKGYLARGVRGLVPLRMQEIADEVGVHISTVSRAVAGKHVQTPRGTVTLKAFFLGGTETESGAVESQAGVQQRLREIVQAENGAEPLSDDQLAEALESRYGIHIARRTVTKYRKALGIAASNQRREY